ncbi:uncharacterized protein [Paramormyrops kingsleyae]|uniref:Uncharacterized LOC111852713 n=1 Tax=Paramormyrops kingsleyae TaxID=1676925 RepID=A0A3B3SI13_9TELE|nr:uncharacterized protein LOC111852713 [Paramormyrops kingsleyae]XP_023684695.1 uncharacterized protein LOC111852713 [Paramormyrops kingsleyae]
MMFVGSNMNSKSSLGKHNSSPVPLHSESDDGPAESSEDSEALPMETLPCWANQALCRLTEGERELQRLRDYQAKELEVVNQALERAILGVQTEERILLERVAQDHRDVQRRLEQLQRENAAAARVGLSLVDERLRQLVYLKTEVKDWPGDQCVSHQNQLLKGVSELLQPWEITLSLKRVHFRPSSQHKPITFGDVQVHQHDLGFTVGACVLQGQPCSLHTDVVQEEVPDGAEQTMSNKPEAGHGPTVTQMMGECVVRNICLCPRNEDVEDEMQTSPRARCWPPLQSPSLKEPSQQDDVEDSNETAPASQNMELDYVGPGDNENEDDRLTNGPRNLKNRNLLSSCQHPTSPKVAMLEHHKTVDQDVLRQDSERRFSNCSHNRKTSPKANNHALASSQSCLCLSSKGYPCSCSSDDHLLRMSGEMKRTSSPTDSLDSCYTFIVSSPRDYSCSLFRDPRISKSTADLSGGHRPKINARKETLPQGQRAKGNFLGQKHQSSVPGRVSTGRGAREQSWQRLLQNTKSGAGQVTRSVSMSVIEGPFPSDPTEDQMEDGEKASQKRAEPDIVKEDEDPCPLKAVRLVRQFGKQGSGRADFTLPSGVHATPQGQLFVVDCGNARVQVTDTRGNVLQQVSTEHMENSNRRCQNYFDIAVSVKGLIALSCAARRALLIFNRHGRHLQTIGGMGARDELEAPRGVAVNSEDDFLVADIRRGTLTVLRLNPKTGTKLECMTVPGFHRPYLVAACPNTRLVAVSERGSETGQAPCVKVLDDSWCVIRVLGVCLGVGPLLSCPWGICIDKDGDVLVADWGKEHQVLIYPAKGIGQALVSQGLRSPRGLTLLPQGDLVVSDSMHHCIKIFQYK